jgi:hypothetical protein
LDVAFECGERAGALFAALDRVGLSAMPARL